jgi:hypothetical protein
MASVVTILLAGGSPNAPPARPTISTVVTATRSAYCGGYKAHVAAEPNTGLVTTCDVGRAAPATWRQHP